MPIKRKVRPRPKARDDRPQGGEEEERKEVEGRENPPMEGIRVSTLLLGMVVAWLLDICRVNYCPGQALEEGHMWAHDEGVSSDLSNHSKPRSIDHHTLNDAHSSITLETEGSSTAGHEGGMLWKTSKWDGAARASLGDDAAAPSSIPMMGWAAILCCFALPFSFVGCPLSR